MNNKDLVAFWLPAKPSGLKTDSVCSGTVIQIEWAMKIQSTAWVQDEAETTIDGVIASLSLGIFCLWLTCVGRINYIFYISTSFTLCLPHHIPSNIMSVGWQVRTRGHNDSINTVQLRCAVWYFSHNTAISRNQVKYWDDCLNGVMIISARNPFYTGQRVYIDCWAWKFEYVYRKHMLVSDGYWRF